MPLTVDLPEALVQSPLLPKQLEQLQRLMRDEAERRRAFVDAILPHEKGEFINGEIVMHSPARAAHVEVTVRLATLLRAHAQLRRLGKVMVEKAMVEFTRNNYEPDVLFFGREKSASIAPGDSLMPVPDFVVEILSPSSEARDRGVKFEDYAAHEVAEYWIVDPEAEVVEQYVLEGEAYALRMKSGSGVLESVAVEGFAAPVRALFDDDANIEALRELLA
jgi:Uma2 family endonuclease